MSLSQKPPEEDSGGLVQQHNKELRRTSPLSLLKGDLSQVTDEVLKLLKDRKRPDKSVSVSSLSLLQEDLNQLREDLRNTFSRDMKTNEPEVSQSKEKSYRPPSLHKDHVFRTGLNKDKEEQDAGAKSSERAEDTLMKVFRGQQRSLETPEDKQNMPSHQAENQTQVCGGTGDQSLDGPEERRATEETAETSANHREETMWPSQADAAGDRCEGEVEDGCQQTTREDQPLERHLFSELRVFGLREESRDQDLRKQMVGEGGCGVVEGDPWSLKNFACYLTLDPSTANSELLLTDGNRTATRFWTENRRSDHLDRFRHCPQVLCREGLLDSVYWEVEWIGGADVGVAYNSLCRNGDVDKCLLGQNPVSWSLECLEGVYTPCHNSRRFKSSSPTPFSHRVGLYLNWYAGTLSFYCISQDHMVHIHTFSATFSQPLYPGFWVWAYNGSVTLCQVELGWERLLQ